MISVIQTRQISKIGRRRLVLPPAAEPVAGLEYAAYLRVPEGPAAAQVIDDKLRGARDICERWTRRAFVQQTWDFILDLPPGFGFNWRFTRFAYYVPSEIELPKPPFIALVGIYLTDDTGDETLIDPSLYWVSTTQEPARIIIREQESWPDPAGRTFETFRMRFVCGYARPFTINPATGVITCTSLHGYKAGDAIVLSNERGALPGGLLENTPYFAVNVDPLGFYLQLSTDGVTPIASTANAGAGFSFLGEVPRAIKRGILATAAEDFYGIMPFQRGLGKNPEAEAKPGDESIPKQAKSLLRPYRLFSIGYCS